MYRRSDKEKDQSTRLYLERTPSSGSQREIDEVVPEFMHRAFYRSTEDEYQAVEAGALKPRLVSNSGERKAVPPPQSPPAPLRSRTPEPEPSIESEPPLEPLRSPLPDADFAEGSMKDTIAVPLKTLPQPPQPPPPGQAWPPPPGKEQGINFPLVACLLLVVGLFIWRENTRPDIPPEKPLPVPEQSLVVDKREEPQPPALGEESPYPEMTPAVPVEAEVEVDPESVEIAQPEVADETEEVAEETVERETTYPSRDASAQRAAIMEQMSDRTVTNMERSSREERVLPPDDGSLFPMDEPPSKPATASAPAKPKTETAKVAETKQAADAAADSLFPEDETVMTAPVPPKQPVAATRPPAKPPVTANPPVKSAPGEPYEIAEPTF